VTGEHRKPAAPVAKVTAAGAGGAVAVVGVYVAGLFGVEVPAEVAAAVSTLAAFAAGYLKR
jgi:hypothetical protein